MDPNSNLKLAVWLRWRDGKDKEQSGCGEQSGIKVLTQVSGGARSVRAESKKPADRMTARRKVPKTC